MRAKEWAGGSAAASPQPGRGRAGQHQGRDGRLLALEAGRPWLGHGTDTAPNTPRPPLSHVAGPGSETDLVPSLLPSCWLLCEWGSAGSFETSEASCPGLGALCGQD